jgi:hypothetical protein
MSLCRPDGPSEYVAPRFSGVFWGWWAVMQAAPMARRNREPPLRHRMRQRSRGSVEISPMEGRTRTQATKPGNAAIEQTVDGMFVLGSRRERAGIKNILLTNQWDADQY